MLCDKPVKAPRTAYTQGSDLDLLVRVRPQQVAQQPGVRHVRRPPDALDLLQRFELRRQPAVHAQDLRSRKGGCGRQSLCLSSDKLDARSQRRQAALLCDMFPSSALRIAASESIIDM